VCVCVCVLVSLSVRCMNVIPHKLLGEFHPIYSFVSLGEYSKVIRF